MSVTLEEHGTRLLQVDGVGAVLAVRLLGRTGRASRFRSSAAFANYAGVAPIEAASGDRARHRLSRSGDRQLNCALHLVAVTQVRMRGSAGRRYYDRKIGEGKTHNEAMRCLKRRSADHVWRLMLADELARHHGSKSRQRHLDKTQRHPGFLGGSGKPGAVHSSCTISSDITFVLGVPESLDHPNRRPD